MIGTMMPLPPLPPEGYLTESEAASLLCMKTKDLRKLARERGIRTITFGGKPLYDAWDVDRAIEDIVFEESGGGAGWCWLRRGCWE